MAMLRNVPRSLFTGILLVFLLTASILVVLYIFVGMRQRHDLASRYLQATASRAVQRYEDLKGNVETVLRVTRDWTVSGVLEPTRARDAVAQLIPMMRTMPNVSSMSVANSRGAALRVSRGDSVWESSRRSPGDGAVPTVLQRWSEDARPIYSQEVTRDEDPRREAWYKEAVPRAQDEAVVWTNSTGAGQPQGRVASTAVSTGGGHMVVSLEITLHAISRIVSTLNLEAGSTAFLFTNDGRVFSPAEASAEGSPFVVPGLVADPHVAAAMRTLMAGEHSAGAVAEFTVRDSVFWIGTAAIDSALGVVTLGVVMPQHMFLVEIRDQQNVYLWISVFVVLIGAAVSVWVVRRYGARSLFRGGDGDFESIVRELTAAGESKLLEFKSTMRMNLATGQAGKEIEIAWLKSVAGFMNTDGGTILIGVDDDGNIIGTEADRFENDDRCRLHFRNLIKTHVGLEFSQSIRFSLGYIDDKRVIMIECQPSVKPVFLRKGKEESFYIRSGPSTVSLTASDMLKYLENRS